LGELLHEIGHTLGNSHVPGTVMDAELSRVFSRVPDLYFAPDFVIDQIDQQRALVHGNELQKMSRVIDWGNAPDDSIVLKPFNKVMKRSHKGEIKSAVEFRESYGKHKKIEGTFSLADSISSKMFTLKAESPFRCSWVGDIFNHYVWEDSDYQNGIGKRSESCQYLGTLSDVNTGEVFPVAIEHDSIIWGFLISLTGTDDDLQLFTYNSPWDIACEPNPACSLIVKPKK
jgi:hypothetical protein